MYNIIFSCGYFLIIRDISWSREILNTNQSTEYTSVCIFSISRPSHSLQKWTLVMPDSFDIFHQQMRKIAFR